MQKVTFIKLAFRMWIPQMLLCDIFEAQKNFFGVVVGAGVVIFEDEETVIEAKTTPNNTTNEKQQQPMTSPASIRRVLMVITGLNLFLATVASGSPVDVSTVIVVIWLEPLESDWA